MVRIRILLVLTSMAALLGIGAAQVQRLPPPPPSAAADIPANAVPIVPNRRPASAVTGNPDPALMVPIRPSSNPAADIPANAVPMLPNRPPPRNPAVVPPKPISKANVTTPTSTTITTTTQFIIIPVFIGNNDTTAVDAKEMTAGNATAAAASSVEPANDNSNKTVVQPPLHSITTADNDTAPTWVWPVVAFCILLGIVMMSLVVWKCTGGKARRPRRPAWVDAYRKRAPTNGSIEANAFALEAAVAKNSRVLERRDSVILPPTPRILMHHR